MTHSCVVNGFLMYWVLVSSRHIIVWCIYSNAQQIHYHVQYVQWHETVGRRWNQSKLRAKLRTPNELFLKPLHEQYEHKINPSLTLNSIHWSAVWKTLPHWIWADLSLSTYLEFYQISTAFTRLSCLEVESSKHSSVLHICRIYFPYNQVLAPGASDSQDWWQGDHYNLSYNFGHKMKH